MLLELIRDVYRLPVTVTRPVRSPLGEVRAQVNAVLAEVAQVRAADNQFWTARLAVRPGLGDRGFDFEALNDWAATSYRLWPVDHVGDEPVGASNAGRGVTHDTVSVALQRAADELAAAASELVDVVASIDVGSAAGTWWEDVAARVTETAGLIGPSSAAVSTRRLLALHVVAESFGDTVRRAQRIELVEASWRTPCAIDERSPESKLAGTEFFRLGAFVKRAWRANDWMWGRLDGTYQMVQLLLDPQRLLQLGRSAEETADALLAVADAASWLSADQVRERRAAVVDELTFLGDGGGRPGMGVPRTLPVCTGLVAEPLQVAVAREELPFVYEAVMASRADGAAEGDFGAFRRAFESTFRPGVVPGHEDVRRVLAACRIGDESAGWEVGQDALTRSLGTVGMVVANALTGDGSGLSVGARVASPLRLVATVVFILSKLMTASSRAGNAVAGLVVGTAGAVVGMDLLGGRVNSGVVFLACAVLLVAVGIGFLRSRLWPNIPLFAAMLAVSLALLGDGLAEVITTGTGGVAGWKSALFLDRWSLFGLLVVVAVVGWLATAIRHVALANRAWRRDHDAWARRRRLAQSMAAVGSSGASSSAAESVEPRRFRSVVRAAVGVVVAVGWSAATLAWYPSVGRWLVTGRDDGWRHQAIVAASWLADRQLIVVLGGLIAAGVFVGMAWDRLVRVSARQVWGALLRLVCRSSRRAP